MKKAIPIVAVIALLVGGFILLQSHFSGTGSAKEETPQVQKDDQKPVFSLLDYSGNRFESKDFKGKIQAINFWASWCPFCKDELIRLEELQAAFPEDVVVIAVNRAEPLSVAKDFSDDLELSGEPLFLLDPNDSFYRSIGGFTMPETLFLDTKGKIVQHKRGSMDLEEMKEVVNGILQK